MKATIYKNKHSIRLEWPDRSSCLILRNRKKRLIVESVTDRPYPIGAMWIRYKHGESDYKKEFGWVTKPRIKDDEYVTKLKSVDQYGRWEAKQVIDALIPLNLTCKVCVCRPSKEKMPEIIEAAKEFCKR